LLRTLSGLGKVAHACNPDYKGAEVGRIAVPGQPGQKARPYLENIQHEIGLAEWLKR
jgi:hypothetical protein